MVNEYAAKTTKENAQARTAPADPERRTSLGASPYGRPVTRSSRAQRSAAAPTAEAAAEMPTVTAMRMTSARPATPPAQPSSTRMRRRPSPCPGGGPKTGPVPQAGGPHGGAFQGGGPPGGMFGGGGGGRSGGVGGSSGLARCSSDRFTADTPPTRFGSPGRRRPSMSAECIACLTRLHGLASGRGSPTAGTFASVADGPRTADWSYDDDRWKRPRCHPL